MELTDEILKSLKEWYESFTFGDVTYKDGTNFISRIKVKESVDKPKKTITDSKIGFGKYKNKTWKEVYLIDSSYIDWLENNTNQKSIKEIIKKLKLF
jgi:hypothetical protein